MSRRLTENLTSSYLGAAQHLNAKSARKKIVAYVESYDDILFWRGILNDFESEKCYFEVMLPSCDSLCKGKKTALMNRLGEQLGKYMIACVDADYDYLMQGKTQMSDVVCNSPYVFHTYTYAIENHQCYAPSLHNVCVMATLNDHVILDFELFMKNFSEIVYPLFIWSVWCYRNHFNQKFTMAELCAIITLDGVNLYHPEETLDYLRKRVNRKINWLQSRVPQAKYGYKDLKNELLELGVTPENTYQFVRGHDIFDNVVLPILETVCDSLRREREREIRRYAEHNVQMQNELAGYQHSSSSPEEMLKKHSGYRQSALYKRIQNDIASFLKEYNLLPTPKSSLEQCD